MLSENIRRGYLVKNRKGLKHWEPLFEEWLLCVERYCRMAAGEDAPFIYTERANIGVLAGAAWRCGRMALEEFQYEKGDRRKRKWKGRADLYLASETTEEIIEAKFNWLPLSSKVQAVDWIERSIEAAKVDAIKTKGDDRDVKCIAVAFLPVWLPRKERSRMEEVLDQTIGCLPSAKCHAIAWCFPREYRYVQNEFGNFTPGVIMGVSNPIYD